MFEDVVMVLLVSRGQRSRNAGEQEAAVMKRKSTRLMGAGPIRIVSDVSSAK